VWVILGLVSFLVALVLVLRSVAEKQSQPVVGTGDFVLLLLAVGALLALSVEFVYIKDHFSNRMNTVFKFYFQAWILWGIGGAYALAVFMRRGGVGAKIVSAVAAILILAGLVYPALAIPKRAAEYGGPATLDGTAYLAKSRPEDYAAIAWLDENVKGAPVILETPGGSYSYEGRVSALTGLPTVLGWAGHEHQWRGTFDEQASRQEDINTLYTSVDKAEVLTLLDKYDISYVYVGPLERNRYPVEGLAKFAGLMEVVYESGGVAIYKR
jgi:YYY domain-containing protein